MSGPVPGKQKNTPHEQQLARASLLSSARGKSRPAWGGYKGILRPPLAVTFCFSASASLLSSARGKSRPAWGGVQGAQPSPVYPRSALNDVLQQTTCKLLSSRSPYRQTTCPPQGRPGSRPCCSPGSQPSPAQMPNPAQSIPDKPLMMWSYVCAAARQRYFELGLARPTSLPSPTPRLSHWYSANDARPTESLLGDR